ncbi:hypothetical protein DPMN_063920 [Dreissena polymorpha]|uniref:Uncharacterized protein n=1 Tax=Dreissena polymorpha TaxID=45954 RepID=A0A9D4HKQ0_DREPO|nr:hypothetical protein DPMN_063920 [Dreissena polymorpha]
MNDLRRALNGSGNYLLFGEYRKHLMNEAAWRNKNLDEKKRNFQQTSSISVPAEPYLPYSIKHYRKRKLEAEQAGEFRRQYNKKLSYRTCNRRIIPTDKFKPEVPVPVAPAPLVRFVTAPAPDLALASSISVPAEPYLP